MSCPHQLLFLKVYLFILHLIFVFDGCEPSMKLRRQCVNIINKPLNVHFKNSSLKKSRGHFD